MTGGLVYDGNPRTVEQFLETLTCPCFAYTDVLRCYNALVASEWRLPTPDQSSSDDDIQLPEDGVGNIEKQIRALIEQQRPSSPPIGRPKKRPVNWTATEIETLRRGVAEFGVGMWAAIVREYADKFAGNGRTARDLCSKYNRLAKQKTRRRR